MATTMEYLPRKPGFEVRLAVGDRELIVRGTGLEDREPQLSGAPDLWDNVALVTLVLGYAANELAYRRLRSPEKRASHREAAEVERKDALALAELAARLGERTVLEWCSGCFSKTTHRHVRGSDRPKRTYLCRQCGTPTVDCSVLGCSHRAVIRPRARIRFSYCAEHRHAIPAFEKLNATIPTLGDYRDFLKHEVRNAERIAKVTGGTIGAGAVVAPIAFSLPRLSAQPSEARCSGGRSQALRPQATDWPCSAAGRLPQADLGWLGALPY